MTRPKIRRTQFRDKDDITTRNYNKRCNELAPPPPGYVIRAGHSPGESDDPRVHNHIVFWAEKIVGEASSADSKKKVDTVPLDCDGNDHNKSGNRIAKFRRRHQTYTMVWEAYGEPAPLITSQENLPFNRLDNHLVLGKTGEVVALLDEDLFAEIPEAVQEDLFADVKPAGWSEDRDRLLGAVKVAATEQVDSKVLGRFPKLSPTDIESWNPQLMSKGWKLKMRDGQVTMGRTA